MPIPSISEFEGWALTGLAGITGAFAIWLRLNKTQTEITKTKTEGGWLTQLVKDRDDAIRQKDEAIEREKSLNTKYEELKAENSVLKTQANIRDEKIDNLYQRVDMLTNLIIEFRPDLEMFLKSAAFGNMSPQESDFTTPHKKS